MKSESLAPLLTSMFDVGRSIFDVQPLSRPSLLRATESHSQDVDGIAPAILM